MKKWGMAPRRGVVPEGLSGEGKLFGDGSEELLVVKVAQVA